jgi:hypothetical protein
LAIASEGSVRVGTMGHPSVSWRDQMRREQVSPSWTQAILICRLDG